MTPQLGGEHVSGWKPRFSGAQSSNVASALSSDTTLRHDVFVRQLVDTAPDGVVLADRDGAMMLVNHQAEQLFGCRQSTLVGHPLDELIPDGLKLAEVTRSVDRRTPPNFSLLQLAAHGRDGDEVPVEVSLRPVDTDAGAWVVAVIRDLRPRLAHERRRLHAELELYLREERERIARDLHDVVVQRLFAAGLELEGAAAYVHDDHTVDRLREVVGQINAAIQDLRATILDLDSARGPACDLRTHLLETAFEATRLLGCEPTILFEGPLESFDDRVRANLDAVLREMLSNVVRHARATAITIEVSATDMIRVRVTDDGVGMPPHPSIAGRGLRNLRSRAEALNGTFVLTAREPTGTVATWSIPRHPTRTGPVEISAASA